MPSSAGEAVLDIRTNSGKFFSDMDAAEKKSLNLGQAFQRVSADTDRFSRSLTGIAPGLSQLSSQAAQFSSAMTTVGVNISAVAAGATVGFAAIGVALFALAQKAAAVGAELDDMADKTGQSVPALSRLSNAAKVIGADMGSLTNLLFEFQKRLGNSTGNDDFADGLKRIGTSFEEVKATNPDRLLELLASRMGGVTDQSELAAASFAIFGKQARDQIAVLKDLNRGLELTADITPWTAEQAAAAEEFEMQLASLKVHVEALAIAFGRDLITTFRDLHLDELAGLFSGLADSIGGVSKAVQILGGQIPLIGQLGSFLGFVDALGKVRDASGYVSAGLRMIRGEMEGVSKATGDATFQAEQFYRRVTAMSQQVQAPTSARPGISAMEAGRSMNQAFSVQSEAVRKLNNDLAAQKTHYDALAAATKRFVAEWEKFERLQIDKTLARMAEAAERLKVLNAVVPLDVQFGIDENDSAQRWQAAADAIITLDGEIQVTTEDITDMALHMVTVGKKTDEATKAFTSLYTGLKKIEAGNFAGGFKEIGESIAAMIDPMTILTNVIVNLIGKLVSFVTNLIEKGLQKLAEGISFLAGKFLDLFSNGIGAMAAAVRAAAQIADDLAAQKEAFADLDATIKKYKFSIEELGPALERQNLDKLSQEIFHDWMLLVSAGISVAAVAREMGESINDFVQRAIRSGFEVPEAMRPIIEEMIRLGLLTDEAGNKIGDLDSSGIRFSMTMTDGFRALIAAVDRLTQAIARALHLTGALGSAVANLPEIPPGYPGSPGQSGGGGGGGGGNEGGGTREAAGDYLHLMRPQRFIAGEAGREDVVFGGAGRNLARDVAAELVRLTPSASHMGATGSREVIIKLDSQVLAKAVIDDFHAGGNNQSKFRQLVQRSGN